MSQTFPIFIDNQWIGPEARRSRPILSPADGTVIADIVCATLDDADLAAAAAKRAFAEWAATPPRERGAVLGELARLVEASIEPIARQITHEQGKPLAEARAELEGVAAMFEHFAGVAESFRFHYLMNERSVTRSVDMIPIGPVLIITTWNFPVETAVVHLAPALAAGCTAVILANHDTPSSVVMLMELIEKSPLPKGAVNLIVGESAKLCTNLIRNRDISHVSYTGSVSVGRTIASECGGQIKRCTLELGGNAPAIVLPGTDVTWAAADLAQKRFWNAGQVCTAPNRIYVHRSLHDPFADEMARIAADLVVGDGMADGTQIGPLANRHRLETMKRIADDALQKGATARHQVAAPENDGNFFPPTVFSDVPDNALGMRDEIFGPIACIAPYDDLETAIDKANDCDLGLSGYVYGPDATEAANVADRLEVGSVAVNQLVTAFIDTPFGGIKSSGLGFVGGETAITEYLFPRLTAAAAT